MQDYTDREVASPAVIRCCFCAHRPLVKVSSFLAQVHRSIAEHGESHRRGRRTASAEYGEGYFSFWDWGRLECMLSNVAYDAEATRADLSVVGHVSLMQLRPCVSE